MKLSFEGVRGNALRQLKEVTELAEKSEDYDEEDFSVWAIECCISAYHDCLLAIMKGDCEVSEIKDFLLAYKTEAEIESMKYCGDVVSFEKKEEAEPKESAQ